MLSNNWYERLKFTVQVLLPGAGALYFALAQIWGLPNAEQVVGTIAAVSVFLGLFLRRSSSIYNSSDAKYDGTFEVFDMDEGRAMGATLKSPETVEDKDELILRAYKDPLA